jgi:hypothetical protein
MAKKSRNRKSNAELKVEIARSREDVGRRLHRVREEADVPQRIRRSVQREPVPWIVGAIAVGLLITAIAIRKKKVVVEPKRGSKSKGFLEAGFLLGALRVAVTLFKPVIVKFVEEKFGHYASRTHSGPKGF